MAVQAGDTLAWEARRGPLAGVAALAAGLLTIAGGIYVQTAVYADRPVVNTVEGLGPLLESGRLPAESPRAALIAFLDANATQLILSSVVSGLGVALIGYALYYLFRATRARRPELPKAVGALALAGPVVLGLATVAIQVAIAINAADFIAGTDRSADAVEQVARSGGTVALQYVALAAQLAVAFAIVMVSLNAMRVGLLTRFMGVLGIIVGVLSIIPVFGSSLPIVQTFWLIALGVLFLGRWPQGTPPAWREGVAIPWPSQQELREQRQREREEPAERDETGMPAAPDKPERGPIHPSSKKRKRKRRG